MKIRLESLALCLALVCALFAGCVTGPIVETALAKPDTTDASVEPETTAAPIQTTTEASDLPSITWQKAFRDNDLPEGEVDANHIAFMQVGGDHSLTVFNVPKEEVYSSKHERLPRSRYFEQFMPQELVDELLPALDYAVAHGYSRMCVPTTGFNYGTVEDSNRYLRLAYEINNSKIGSLGIKEFPQPDGKTLIFMLITIGGMEARNTIDQYLEGLEAARVIVDAMPEGLDELGKVTYLYRWLTDNVRYYDYDTRAWEYYDEANWCMLYDTLVKHRTVCAGYAEAMYVLCNLAGIDCITVSGDVLENGASASHTWNVVRIDGAYYQFDSTWDAGTPYCDYEFFGLSDERMEQSRSQYLTSQAYCPPCETDLLPPLLPIPEDDLSAEYEIIWFYRLRNARNASPLTLFRYLGIDEKSVAPEEPKDGWVKTQVNMTQLFTNLRYIMTEEQVIRFILGYFVNETKDDPCLSYRVPVENPELTRLTGLEQNDDGTWTAQTLRFMPDGSTTPDQETVTMEQIGEYWFVFGVE